MHTLAPRALAHLPFYEALATLDDTADSWRTLSAGLLTVRLFDRWVREESAGRHLARWEVSGVAEVVDTVPSTSPVRSLLARIVAAANARESWSAALPMLSAYGRALNFEAQWAVASDVYTTVLTHAEHVDTDLAIAAAYHCGFSRRRLGDLDGAYEAYATGRRLAVRTGDLNAMLRADVGFSAIAMQRGNLPAAQVELDAVIARAEEAAAECSYVLSTALHDRGVVASRRGRSNEAVGFMHRALRLCSSSTERDRILNDIGAALLRSGAYAAARDAHLIVYSTAQFQDLRWIAGLNLLELSAKTENEPAFERYRRELGAAALPPLMRAHFHMYVAEGHHRFGRSDEAIAELDRAIEMAEANGVNDVAFEAERRRAEVRRARPAVARPSDSTYVESEEVALAAQTIRELREGVLT